MRARNIKPGFFTNEKLVALSPIVRLLFAGLWCMADRRGLVPDRPLKIKLTLFPGDEIDVAAGLDALAAAGLITRYVDANGSAGLLVVNFNRHQNPHHRERDNPDIEPPESGVTVPAGPNPKGPNPLTAALGRPGASPSLAGLIPDSGFLIPDSGILNPEGDRTLGQPAAGPGPVPSRPATAKQSGFAERLLAPYGLTVETWLARHAGSGSALLDVHVDRIRSEYSGPPPRPHAYERPEEPDPELTDAERDAGMAALESLRASGCVPGGRGSARVTN